MSRRYIFTIAVILIVVGIGANNNPKNTVKTDYQLTPMIELTFFVAHQAHQLELRRIVSCIFFLHSLRESRIHQCFYYLQFISVDEFLIDKKKQMGVLSIFNDAL